MARHRVRALATAAAALTAAVVVLLPGGSSAQTGDESFELKNVTLFAGGVGVTVSYTFQCGPDDEGFKIATTISAVNSINGHVAIGTGTGSGECPASGLTFEIFSENGIGFTRGQHGGGHQFCFGDVVDEQVDCEPGGGGLLNGRIR